MLHMHVHVFVLLSGVFVTLAIRREADEVLGQRADQPFFSGPSLLVSDLGIQI